MHLGGHLHEKIGYFGAWHRRHYHSHQNAATTAGKGVADHRHRPGLAAPLSTRLALYSFGIYTPEDCVKPKAKYVPAGVNFVLDEITEIDPVGKQGFPSFPLSPLFGGKA